jgi:hypothetical protein
MIFFGYALVGLWLLGLNYYFAQRMAMIAPLTSPKWAKRRNHGHWAADRP